MDSRLEGGILALDWGLKKVGVATSDPNGIAITVRPLWRRSSAGQIWSFSRDDKDHLSKLISSFETKVIFLGEPRSLDGSSNHASECAGRLASKISDFSGLRVVLVPETLTSWEARHHENEDSAAAALLIQSYFQERRIE